MVSLIFILLAATILVVGGTIASLLLHTRKLSGMSHSAGGRTSEDSYSMRATLEAYTMSRYARNALIILLFGLIVVALIIFSIINGLLQ